MKRVLPILIGSLIGLFLFVMPGSYVEAAAEVNPIIQSADDDCACHDVTPIEGIEKVKITANLLISFDFWKASLQALKEGYYIKDITKIEVIKHNQTGQVMVGVAFENSKGKVKMYVFSNGKFLGATPL
ncbi:hypothetical protein [Neobacillus niacini]|uniref:hypothetical protein n=1 Tax=Neobacillus niacini TaxID=86668 RepID=UPI0021CB5FCD|nr:hypothetical protein [Neobacillus niacini]MCM3765459.1 hypothetical protein [Neobacillus niacini]